MGTVETLLLVVVVFLPIDNFNTKTHLALQEMQNF